MNKPYPLYDVERITNLRQLIDFRANESPSAIAFEYAADKNSTEKITFAELKRQTEALGTALFDTSIKNCHTAILGENSYNWLLSFFALTGGNNVVVPIDKELSVNMIAKLISDSDCSALIYSDTYADIAEELQKNIDIRYINMNDPNSMIEKGIDLIAKGNNEYLTHNVDEDRTTVIVYTSETTGISKGVMLSHKNLALNIYSACQNCKVDGDVVLLLPLHHTFGMVAGVFMIMLYGHTVYINSSLRYLTSDLTKVKPKILFVVPLLAETLYKNIWNAVEQSGKTAALKQLIGESNVLLAAGTDNRKEIV